MKQIPQAQQQGQPQPDVAHHQIAEESQRLEDLENRLTETGIGLLIRKAAQDEPAHHSRPSSRAMERKTDYDRLYEEPTDGERRQEPNHPDRDR